MCVKELLKLLFPVNHYLSSFTTITLSVMIICCVWRSAGAGATCINTKEQTVCDSFQPCVQCLCISHLMLAKVGWQTLPSALTAQSSLITINQHTAD